MAINLLALSVGNTRTKVGLFLAGKLASSQAVLNDNLDGEFAGTVEPLLSQVKDTESPGLILASVNNPVAQRVIAALAKLAPELKICRPEDDLPIPIGRQLDREALVGEDRLLNAAAAYDVLKQACIVVDAGTALTVDFIDGAGTFHGGAIAPGAQMMLDALHAHTAQLPQVTLARPEEPIGHNTTQAMLTAVFHGLRGMVRELTEQYAEVAGSYPLVVATGGNAELLFKDYELIDRIVPDLTLLGLAATWRSVAEEQEG